MVASAAALVGARTHVTYGTIASTGRPNAAAAAKGKFSVYLSLCLSLSICISRLSFPPLAVLSVVVSPDGHHSRLFPYVHI